MIFLILAFSRRKVYQVNFSFIFEIFNIFLHSPHFELFFFQIFSSVVLTKSLFK